MSRAQNPSRLLVATLTACAVMSAPSASALDTAFSEHFRFYPDSQSSPLVTLLQYLPDRSRVVAETGSQIRPMVCRSTGSTSATRLALDANAFHDKPSLFETAPLRRLSYLPGSNPASSILIEGVEGQTTLCHVYVAETPLVVTPSPCDTTPLTSPAALPLEDMPIFGTGFEPPNTGLAVHLREFTVDSGANDILRFRLDIHLDAASAGRYPAQIALREWFGHVPDRFSRILGASGPGQVSRLECNGHGPFGDPLGQARCNGGTARLNWLAGAEPYIAKLDNAYLPPGGCLRIDGERRISPGAGSRSPRYGMAVFNYGGTADQLVTWKTVPQAN